MQKISTLIDRNSTKEFMHGTYIFAWISLIVALGIIGLYITFGVINNSWNEFLQIVLVVLGGVLLVLCILILFNYWNALKKMDGFKRTIIYEFLDDALCFEIYRENEVIENGKIYYQDFLDYKVSKNYVFLRLKNNTWLAIKKEESLVDFINSKGIAKYKAFRMNKR